MPTPLRLVLCLSSPLFLFSYVGRHANIATFFSFKTKKSCIFAPKITANENGKLHSISAKVPPYDL